MSGVRSWCMTMRSMRDIGTEGELDLTSERMEMRMMCGVYLRERPSITVLQCRTGVEALNM